MNLLIDTNIILEIILNQERAEEARRLFSDPNDHSFFISDFSLHSVGVFFFKRNQKVFFRQFLIDVIKKLGITVVQLPIDAHENMIEIADKFNLDFDDSYQYAVSEQFDLTLVSFDSHFDKTDLKRKTPGQIIK